MQHDRISVGSYSVPANTTSASRKARNGMHSKYVDEPASSQYLYQQTPHTHQYYYQMLLAPSMSLLYLRTAEIFGDGVVHCCCP
eukprot:3511196-Rhodomonas_salina.1